MPNKKKNLESKIIPDNIENDNKYNSLISEFNKINDVIAKKQDELVKLDNNREKIINKIKEHLNL